MLLVRRVITSYVALASEFFRARLKNDSIYKNRLEGILTTASNARFSSGKNVSCNFLLTLIAKTIS